jgi:hypothetical protein
MLEIEESGWLFSDEYLKYTVEYWVLFLIIKQVRLDYDGTEGRREAGGSSGMRGIRLGCLAAIDFTRGRGGRLSSQEGPVKVTNGRNCTCFLIFPTRKPHKGQFVNFKTARNSSGRRGITIIYSNLYIIVGYPQ